MEPLIAKTNLGQYRGYYVQTQGGRRVIAFNGIRYAKPPVHSLRFKDAEAIEAHEGIYEATQDGDDSVQQVNGYCKYPAAETMGKIYVGSEDCLFLNVYTPKVNPERGYPVMVYIHGGGYTKGTCSYNFHGPHMLLDKDVILVTITYRLNVFGFLAFDDEILPGNYGIKDQVLALQWIKNHIVNFGGDADNITLVGHSAGAVCAEILITLPATKGIIKRIIIQSGSIHCTWAVTTRQEAKKFALELATALQCPTTPAQLLKSLQERTVEEIMKAVIDINGKDRLRIGHSAFGPVEERQTGNHSPIKTSMPMMIGVTQDEGIVFYRTQCRQGDESLSFINDNYREIFPLSFHYKGHQQEEEITKAIKEMYFGDQDISINTRQQFVDMTADLCLVYGVFNSVRHHLGPTYLYILNHQGERSLSDGFPIRGVCHGDELFYLFPFSKNSTKIEFNQQDAKVQQLFLDLWTNFATNGNPTQNMDEFQWPEAEKGKNFISITSDGIKQCYKFLPERMARCLTISTYSNDK